MALNASRHTPPPLPPRPLPSSDSLPSSSPPPLSHESDNSTDTASIVTVETEIHIEPEEQQLTDEQLRQLYDDEEIERFLGFFSSYVNEVRAAQPKAKGSARSGPMTKAARQKSTGPDTTQKENWHDLNASVTELQDGIESDTATTEEHRSMSEIIAMDCIRPLLPPNQVSFPTLSIGHIRSSAQRLYLATDPIYMPLVRKCISLCTWQDWYKSARYCLAYWVLWASDLLLPGALLGILWALIRRRIFTYPTLSELRARRDQEKRASALGEQIQARLASGSNLGVKDMWRLYKVARTDRKIQNKVHDVTSAVTDQEPCQQTVSACLGTEAEDEEERERKLGALVLHMIDTVADNHERLKNLFLWRVPAASLIYGALIFTLFLFSFITPTELIVKSTMFLAGFIFWHVVPIAVYLTPADLTRLPPILPGLPTDADYAMELISQRVAAGLDVRPSNTHRVRRERRKSSFGDQAQTSREAEEEKENIETNVDWKKWGERAARGKAWMNEGKRVLTGKTAEPSTPPTSQIVDVSGESHTYPVQHSSAPGLITLTPSTLLFSNIVSSNAKIVIPLNQIQGVKKGGLMGGLMNGMSIRWNTVDGEEKMEKFHWVGGRDDLFARLIAINGRKWIRG